MYSVWFKHISDRDYPDNLQILATQLHCITTRGAGTHHTDKKVEKREVARG